MPKINREEYEILQFLNNTKDWIVRNPDGQLWAVEGEAPWKAPFYETWKENDGQDTTKVDVNSFLFQFIQWEDEEPYSIQELIDGYESELFKNAKNVNLDASEIAGNASDYKHFYKRVGESEEKEAKKDLEWLKNEVNEIKKLISDAWGAAIIAGNRHFEVKNSSEMQIVKRISDLINQLDEPEVLSQEFIDKYKVDYDNWMPAVPIVHLQNLLVPKKEVSMIPNYVAKWISRHHEQFDLYPALKRLENNMSSWENVYEWYRENTRNFVNAYLTGEYEIEQEPKYYAKIKGHENIGSNDKYWNYNTDMEELSIGDSEVHPNVISEYVLKATKDEWANLGITDDNADFELVEELEE